MALSAILFGALATLDPDASTAMPLGAFGVVAAAMFVLFLPVTRWFFGLGARTGLKGAARRVARAERG